MDSNGRWQDMFDTGRRSGPPPGGPAQMSASAAIPREAPSDADELALDLSVYRPWILQRGGSRPAMLLEFRQYEPRSGLWTGHAIAYPCLIGLKYTGDRLVSLDFGSSQVLVEGSGLNDLVRHLQQGNVQTILEYSEAVWPRRSDGPCVRAIRSIESRAGAADA